MIGYFRGLKQETGWYGATIADVLVDNDTDGADRIRYRVDWDDGDTRDTHKTSVDIAIVMANLQLNPAQLPGAFYFEDGANVPGTCRPCPDAVSSLQASRLGQQVSCDSWGCGSEDGEEDQPKKADVSTG